MSSGGELIGGILGIALAGIPGGAGFQALTAWQGFQIGAAVGGMLAPNDAPNIEQGRLSDVRGSGSSQGVPIPKVYGRQRVGCVVVFASDVKEVAVDQGGGGGKK